MGDDTGRRILDMAYAAIRKDVQTARQNRLESTEGKMADDTVRRILDMAYAIRKHVKTARQNRLRCHRISERLAEVIPHLERLEENSKLMKDRLMRQMLESMEKTLKRALGLVKQCQGKKNVLHYINDSGMSKQLLQMNEEISRTLLFGFLTSMTQSAVDTRQVVQSDQGSFAENYRMENLAMEFDLLESILRGNKSPSHVKLPFLQVITKDFSDELKIGNGGCGVVYKGILRNQIIAVKRLLNSRTIEDKMFHGEVKSMMMVNHKNVVRFLGYCSHTEEQALKMEGNLVMAQHRERLLCFEYLINGSLERYLTDEIRGLEWETRFQIIKGICDGLHHLHIENHIIHMDLKPDNILLDSNMVPKITDFGLSRLDNISQTMSTERLVSLGYCAPEYMHHGKMSAKADIYSLGVIILVLVTGSKEEPNITKVHRRWKHRWTKIANDARLGYKQVATCLDLVGRCMQKNPTDRPNILDIISDLNKMDSRDATECMDLKDMLGIEPLEIHLLFEPNKQIPWSIDLTNDTDDHFAFRISTNSLRPYHIEANEGTVPPRSKCSVTISMQALDRAPPDHQCRDEFCVRSTTVDGSLVAMNILLAGDMFTEEAGKLIDTVGFNVVLSEAASPSADHALRQI